MKTEQLKEWGLSEEQIRLVFKENGKEIEVEKAKAADAIVKLEAANGKITEYEAKITELQATDNDAERFKAELEALRQQMAEEKAAAERAEKEAAEEADLQARFNGVAGENKWRDELTERAVYAEFKKALADGSNQGKGDKEVLEELTKDRDYWVNPNKPADMTGMGNASLTELEESNMRAIMGLSARE